MFEIGTVYNTVIGGSGNDTLGDFGGKSIYIGNTGNDTISGSLGSDTASYINASGPVVVTLTYYLSETTVTSLGGPRTITVVSVGGESSGADGEDSLRNVSGIQGSRFSDVLTGNELYNYFLGGQGNDVIDGGGGWDIVDYMNASGPVAVVLTDDTGSGYTGGSSAGADGSDVLMNIEEVRGGRFADVLVGNSAANSFYGAGGSDTLFGAAGLDTAIFTVARSSVTIVNNVGGSKTVTAGAEGVDTLIDMEWAVFSDGMTWLGPQGDHFNIDGQADIIWRHQSGSMAIWSMNSDGTYGVIETAAAASDWQIKASGDLNGDGITDLLWRNEGGLFAAWLMNSDGSYSQYYNSVVSSHPGLDWSISGAGDVDGDGRSDVLWRHDSGAMTIWLSGEAGESISFSASGPGAPGTDWQLKEIADFNGDGRADIFWRHDSGQVTIWNMDGASVYDPVIPANPLVPGFPGMDWNVQEAGDFNGDGLADVLWRNDGGAMSIWRMKADGTYNPLNPEAPGLDWQIQKTGDFNGDGFADIVWRHDSGAMSVWNMHGDGTHDVMAPTAPGTDWMIQ